MNVAISGLLPGRAVRARHPSDERPSTGSTGGRRRPPPARLGTALAGSRSSRPGRLQDAGRSRHTRGMDLRWDAVTVDCREPHELARFWCALLGVEVRGTWEQYVGLTPAAPGLPRLVFQRTSDPRPAKNTLHLDLHVPADDLPDAVENAIALGATLE